MTQFSRRFHPWIRGFVFISSIFWLLKPATADDLGAIASGTWNNPANWTGGMVPGSGDNAFIGSTFPTGSIPTATINLDADQVVNNLTLGNNAGTNGTLDLNGFNLTVNNTLSIGPFGGVGTIIHNGGTFATQSLIVSGGNTFGMAAGDTTNNLTVNTGSSVSTAAVGNVSTGVLINGAGANSIWVPIFRW